MPQPVTEVAFVPMVPGADLTDPDNFAYKIITECCEITRRQPGYERGVWGVYQQEPQMLVTLTDWDEVESHEKFTKTAEHDYELELFAKICNQPLEVFHVNMEHASGTTAASKMQSPVIEIVTGYFPVEKAKQLIGRHSDSSDHVNGEAEVTVHPKSYAYGWAIEDEGPIWGTDGVQGPRPGKEIEKPWCGIFGWDGAHEQDDYVSRQTKWIKALGGEIVVGRGSFVDY